MYRQDRALNNHRDVRLLHGREIESNRLKKAIHINSEDLHPYEFLAVCTSLFVLFQQSDQDELEKKEDRDAVRLMTVHASKGLEFPYVFISGLEEGLFPHERLDNTGIDHEEERRLFYVALTRAEKKVFLCYAHIRTIFGQQKVNMPSTFLNDISTEHVESTSSMAGGNSGGFLGDVGNSGYETTVFLD